MTTFSKLLAPLAAASALYAGVPAPRAAQAATIVAATNCNNSGPGSLRSAVFSAPDAAVINLRSLACNRIVLTGGAIAVAQDDLQILGRGRKAITIDGNGQDRVFRHTGGGTLRITGVTLTNGVNAQQFASGGCVQSNGRVSIESSSLHHCQATGVRNPDDQCDLGCPVSAEGGAVFGRVVRLSHSRISTSRANAFDSRGGGVFAVDRVIMFNSRVTGNVATNGTGVFAGQEFDAHDSLLDHNGLDFGETFADQGAVYVFDGVAVLVRSAVTDNYALSCAGVCVEGRGAIVNSTIARNQGNYILRFSDSAFVSNSTVAVNRKSTAPVANPALCRGAITTPLLMLDSSIVALNICGSDYALDIDGGTVTGNHNLVQRSRAPLPADTLRVNPKLQTLRDNGGPTPTMALIEGSPAINHGSNPLELLTDQRGRGFDRVVGPAADIGSFEFRQP